MTKLTLSKVQKALKSIRDKSGLDITIDLAINFDVAIYKVDVPELSEFAEIDYYDENAIIDYLNELKNRI